MKTTKTKVEPNYLQALIQLGKDAKQGKICNQCGREFKTILYKIRLCAKCEKGNK